MALYVCKACLEKSSAPTGKLNMPQQLEERSGGTETRALAKKLFGFLGAVLGGALGMLSGQPVVVGAGAAVGCELGARIVGAVQDMANSRLPEAAVDQCQLCTVLEALEPCIVCSRRVCSSCREVVMAEQERNGEHIYRHYEKRDDSDEAGSHCLAPWNVLPSDDEDNSAGYRLSDEAYLLDEETGELVPVTSSVDDESAEAGDIPSDDWNFSGASVSPTPDEWGDFASWESSDWDAGSQVSEAEGGESE